MKNITKIKSLIYPIVGFIILSGCESSEIPNINEDRSDVLVTIDYDFFDSGSMTRIGDVMYQNFYEKYIKTKRLTPNMYEISFINKDRGDSVVIKGDWNKKEFITLTEGNYDVKGISYPTTSMIPMQPFYISQDTISLVFNERIKVSKDISSIKLTAKYDCFMLMFDNRNFTNIRFGSFSPKTEARKLDEMYYMFFRDISLIKQIASTHNAPLLCTRTNGSITELWIDKFDFKKGKFYYFKDTDGSFDIPPMEDGSITNNI